VLTATTTSRLGVTLGSIRGIPAARTEGLGATVAGSVSRGTAVAATLLTAAVLIAISVVHDGSWLGVGRVLWTMTAGIAVAALCYLVAVRRVGGMTGDVLGAAVEMSTTAALLAVCIRA
jgi:adenosylcobinamide-GDP ribazoletransferase